MNDAVGSNSSRLQPIDASWCSWNGVHGGYALALAAKLAQGADPGFPRALHGSFISPVPPDTALEAGVTELRRGRSSADVRVEVYADSRRVLDVYSSFDRQRTGPDFERFPAPAVPPRGECEEFALPVDLVPFTSHIDVRPTDDARPIGGGSDPELTAWIRLEGAALEPWQAVTVLLDALPPALYAVATVPAAVPTTTLSIALLDRAQNFDPEAWALVRIRTDFAAGGWAVESSAVWTEHGSLLGYASQQRRVLSALH